MDSSKGEIETAAAIAFELGFLHAMGVLEPSSNEGFAGFLQKITDVAKRLECQVKNWDDYDFYVTVDSIAGDFLRAMDEEDLSPWMATFD